MTGHWSDSSSRSRVASTPWFLGRRYDRPMTWVPAVVGALVIVSIVTIGIMLMGLARDGIRLFRSGVDLIAAMAPVLDDISRGAIDAQDKMTRIQETADSLGSRRR